MEDRGVILFSREAQPSAKVAGITPCAVERRGALDPAQRHTEWCLPLLWRERGRFPPDRRGSVFFQVPGTWYNHGAAASWRSDLKFNYGAVGRNTKMTLKWQDYIEERKEVMLGKPVFKGTRLTVEHVLRQVGAGMTIDELLDQYPTLKPEHIRAAMLYAADVVTMDQSIYQ
jgi:uncharacterized protein (DUF433 family)